MDDALLGLGLFIIAMVVHEFGHWIHEYSITLKKPKVILFKLVGIPVGFAVEVDNHKNTILSKFCNHSFGVGMGMLTLSCFGAEPFVFLVYLVACFGDFCAMFCLLLALSTEPYKSHYSWHTLICDIGCDRCIDLTNKDLNIARAHNE